MRQNVESNVRKYIEFIANDYYELHQLKVDHFSTLILIEGFPINDKRIFLTTSGNDQEINKRRELLRGLSPNKTNTIMNSFFLKLAKLFEFPGRDRPISIIMLFDLLSKNSHLFKDINELESILKEWEIEKKQNRILIDNIIEHRNKCLAHNDSKTKCSHLDSMSTNDTDKLMSLIVKYINRTSVLFNIRGIDQNKLEKIKSDALNANTKLMFELEKKKNR